MGQHADEVATKQAMQRVRAKHAMHTSTANLVEVLIVAPGHGDSIEPAVFLVDTELRAARAHSNTRMQIMKGAGIA